MAEKTECTTSWLKEKYDFSLYVIILNKDCMSSDDVKKDICEEGEYRVFEDPTDSSKWNHIVIKYPHKTLSLGQARHFYSQEIIHRKFSADIVLHLLAFFTKVEEQCPENLKAPSYVIIRNFVDVISPDILKTHLSKFGNVEMGIPKCTSSGEPFILVKCETLAEAFAVGLVLHGHTVNGHKLILRFCIEEKEKHIFSVYRNRYRKCWGLVGDGRISLPPYQSGAAAEENEETKDDEKNQSSDLSVICDLCTYRERRSFKDLLLKRLKIRS